MPAASLHPRHNAIAELDAQIARAEVTRARYRQDLEAMPGARRARVLLRTAEEHLARLRRSREGLLAEGPGRSARWLAPAPTAPGARRRKRPDRPGAPPVDPRE
jgi:hypothetical protein